MVSLRQHHCRLSASSWDMFTGDPKPGAATPSCMNYAAAASFRPSAPICFGQDVEYDIKVLPVEIRGLVDAVWRPLQVVCSPACHDIHVDDLKPVLLGGVASGVVEICGDVGGYHVKPRVAVVDGNLGGSSPNDCLGGREARLDAKQQAVHILHVLQHKLLPVDLGFVEARRAVQVLLVLAAPGVCLRVAQPDGVPVGAVHHHHIRRDGQIARGVHTNPLHGPVMHAWRGSHA
mmetsp:Transcript_29448/g.83056  ORF Transcript_29448/g.83056 Transcript_29448/m.83056 type:complete len:233 (+) Transcript_29448:142-840(+)